MRVLACLCLSVLLCGPSLPAAAGSAAPPTRPIARVLALPAGADDCAGMPGALVHDDGTYESGFGGYFKVVDTSEYVDRFVPSVHPATFTDVCVAISVTGPGVSDFDFEVRIYAGDGPDGGPGTLLGAQPARIEDVPAYVFGGQAQFFRVDIAPLQVAIAHGAAYIGVEWNDMRYPGNFLWINTDAWSGGPFGGGYYRNTFTPWTSLYASYLSSYRALQVRAVERALAPTLALDTAALAIHDQCAALPGRGNGVAEPGEQVDLVVPLLASASDFTGVRLTLVPPLPDGVRAVVGTADVGTMTDGDRVPVTLGIALEPTAACLQDVVLPVAIDSDQGSFAGTLTVPVGRTAAATGPGAMPLRIPNDDADGIRSTIAVAQTGVLEALSVQVMLDHYTVSDLVITLTSPTGTTLTLLDRPGYPPFPGCENAVGTLHFIDGAPDPEHVCAEPPGGTPWPVDTAAPVQPFATLRGEPLQGTWTLTVADPAAANAGALLGWSLQPVPALDDVCSLCAAAPEAIYADGFDGS